jgi:hypothetical protein
VRNGTPLDNTWTARRAAGVFDEGGCCREEQEDMVTNYPQSIAADRRTTRDIQEEEGFSGRVLDRLRQAVCGLHGHDTLVQFEHDRMFLRCVSCGHETQGWEFNDLQPPTVKISDAHPARPRPQLIGERRIA